MNSRNPANRYIYARPPNPVYVQTPVGRQQRTVRDKNGDPIAVYRIDMRYRNQSDFERQRVIRLRQLLFAAE